MWSHTRAARRLGVAHAIVQGPFGGGASSPALAAAVSNAGGLGSFGAGQAEPDAIRAAAAAIRALTDKPFALNLWVPMDDPPVTDAMWEAARARFGPEFAAKGLAFPDRPARFMPDYGAQVEALLEARPAVFSFVFGVPAPDVLEACRSRGIVTMGTAAYVDEAAALEAAGVDVVVATGAEAGGHRTAFLHPPATAPGLMALLPQVADAVRIPVVAAGGMADGRTIAAALALGADGVQVGTAFLACRESNVSDAHRAAIRGEGARRTRLTPAFSGRLARGIPNRFMDDVDGDPAGRLPYPAQNWLTRPLRGTGDPALLSLWAGQNAPLVRHEDAAALFEFLLADTARVLGRRA